MNTVVKRSVDDQSSYESSESYNNQDYKDYYYFEGRRKEEPYLHVRRKRQSGNVVTIPGGQTATVTFNADDAGSATGFSLSFQENAGKNELEANCVLIQRDQGFKMYINVLIDLCI